MLLNLPLRAESTAPARLRPLFSLEIPAASLATLEFFSAIGSLLKIVCFLNIVRHRAGKARTLDPRAFREEDPAGYGADSADRNSLAKWITDSKRRVLII